MSLDIANLTSTTLQGNVSAELQIQSHTPIGLKISTLMFLGIVMLFSILGNFSVVIAVLKTTFKSSTDYFVVTIAFVDLISALTVVPIMVMRRIDPIWHAIASELTCRTYCYFIYFTSISSTVLLSFLATDRYLRIVWPLSRLLLPRRAKAISKTVFALALIICIPTFTISYYDSSYGKCSSNETTSLIFDTMLCIVFIVLFAVTTYAYTVIASKIRKFGKVNPASVDYTSQRLNYLMTTDGVQGRNIFVLHNTSATTRQEASNENVNRLTHDARTRDKLYKDTLTARIAFAMFLIILTHVITWTISWVAWGIPVSENDPLRPWLEVLKDTFIVNCATNPVFYTWQCGAFRKKMISILRSYFVDTGV